MNESFPDENRNEPVSPSCSCHGADTSDATPSNILNPDSGGSLSSQARVNEFKNGMVNIDEYWIMPGLG